MNIRDLEYLVALSEHKHFRRAAEACHISQPTLSGQIRKLEDELGVILLERTSRKVLFTQSGLLLIEQAHKILREIQVFKEMASNQGRDMVGPIHIGIIPTIAPYLLPQMLPNLQQEFPELEIFVYEAQTKILLEQLENGQIDCAVLAATKETNAFIEQLLYHEPMLLAVSTEHSWANKPNIQSKDLKEQEILMLDVGNCLRDHNLSYCVDIGAKENTHFLATSLETLRNMVEAKIGIALMPKLATLIQKQDNIKYLSCVDPEPLRDMILIYRPGSPLRVRYDRIAASIRQTIPAIIEKLG